MRLTRRQKRILKKRILRWAIRQAMTIAYFAVVILISWHVADFLVQSKKALAAEAVRPILTEEVAVQANLDAIMMFEPETWISKLSLDEKKKAIRQLVEPEACNLGLSVLIRVEFCRIPDNRGGDYGSEEGLIRINENRLEICTSYEAINTICHEMRHAWQYEMITVYCQVEERHHSLPIFKDVDTFYEEFQNYCSGVEDVDRYYVQTIERDAREYASSRVQRYTKVIEENRMGYAVQN